MTSLYQTLRSSLSSLFSISTAATAPVQPPQYTLEDIRAAMEETAAFGGGDRGVALSRRIRYAADVQALWFIRSDLMALVARSHGEPLAREKLEAVTAMFTGMLPTGLRSRPSPLASGSPVPSDFHSSHPD